MSKNEQTEESLPDYKLVHDAAFIIEAAIKTWTVLELTDRLAEGGIMSKKAAEKWIERWEEYQKRREKRGRE